MIPITRSGQLGLLLAFGLITISAQDSAKDETFPDTGGSVVNLDYSHYPLLGTVKRKPLFDNGPLVNNTGGGVGGSDESVLQNVTLMMTTFGFGHRVLDDNHVADDFTIEDLEWELDSIVFYAYQTFSTLTSTITEVRYQIWDGPPDDALSSVVYGDLITNRLVTTTWSNIYRVDEETSGMNTDRPVMKNTVSAGVTLPTGTYWLEWFANGTLSSGPWAPPITINEEATTGNALWWIGSTSTWQDANDNGTITPQGFPYQIYGEAHGLPQWEGGCGLGYLITANLCWIPSIQHGDSAILNFPEGCPTCPGPFVGNGNIFNSDDCETADSLGLIGALTIIDTLIKVDTLPSFPYCFQRGTFTILRSMTIDSSGMYNIQSNDSSRIPGSLSLSLNGALVVDSGFHPVISVGGSWFRSPTSVFDPGLSTVVFTGMGIFSRNFNNLLIDTGSTMTSAGNVAVTNQCEVRNRILLQSIDTLLILNGDSSALFGAGIIDSGTIHRTVDQPARYRFESDNTYAIFGGSAALPDAVAVTGYPDVDPLSFGSVWIPLGGIVDTFLNTIRLDTTQIDGRWTIGKPRDTLLPGDTIHFVRRVYSITTNGGTDQIAGLSMRYEPSEIPMGVAEDSLQAYRLDVSAGYSAQESPEPLGYLLFQNFPNPFNPSTQIQYYLPAESHVRLIVYNILGQQVRTILDGIQSFGLHRASWDGTNEKNTGVGTGVYFYRLEASSKNGQKQNVLQVRKMIFLE